MGSFVRRAIPVTLLSLTLLTMQGCTYLGDRARDAGQMGDLGVTWTATPYGSFYVCGGGLASLGLGHVDGKFAGIGGNQVGVTRHYHKVQGLLLWGYEEVGWGEDFDVTKPETLTYQHVCLLGYINDPPRRPSYGPACMHYFHAGYGGLVLNLRYTEILDFLGGWFGYDLAGDDEGKRDHWPWQDETAQNVPKWRPELKF